MILLIMPILVAWSIKLQMFNVSLLDKIKASYSANTHRLFVHCAKCINYMITSNKSNMHYYNVWSLNTSANQISNCTFYRGQQIIILPQSRAASQIQHNFHKIFNASNTSKNEIISIAVTYFCNLIIMQFV